MIKNHNKKTDSNESNNISINQLCSQSPFLLISTPFGVGRYRFNKIGYNNNNELIIEYKIVDDLKYTDSSTIKYYIGKYYYLSSMQVLYASSYVVDS
tara:strand:- start:160 stop:450 length:291 start_codon:yes stop_codon:yes gene_type:complete